MTNGKDLANPVVQHTDGSTMRMECTNAGLTKRELFAAMAMQGYLAGSEHEITLTGEPSFADLKMKYCVGIADALINALNKEQ